MYLKFKYVPDPIDTYQYQVSSLVIILVQKLNKYIEPTGTDKHLKGQCWCLIHLPHKRGSFKSDFIWILPRGKLGYDRNAADETEIFLDLNIIQYDLISVSLNSTSRQQHSLVTYCIHHFQQPQNHIRATFDSARFEYFQYWQHSMRAYYKSFCIFWFVENIKLHNISTRQ